jgi:hypothetical protein
VTIQAIETRYAGCRFRSRAEARLAVFLDALKVPWLYEPEGYLLRDGIAYLPDFLLYPGTDWAFWLEVKAQAPTGDEILKCAALAEETGIRTYLYFDRNFEAAAEQPYVFLADFFNPVEWFETADGEWSSREVEPAWKTQLPHTAYHFPPAPSTLRTPRPGRFWWMDCQVCGRVRLKLYGQRGHCPDAPESYLAGVPWPTFAHRTPRLLKAYAAARSARFEFGESGAR